jgi:acyl carrier protein
MTDDREFLEWCSNLFSEPVERLSMQTSRADIRGWDSMGSLLLLADLDEMYDIQIGEQGLSELLTLSDLAALIASRITRSG